MTYYILGELQTDFDRAIGMVTEAPQAEDCSALTEIDVKATMKAKLGVEIPRYSACGSDSPHCLNARSGSTSSTSNAAASTMPRAPHEGQNPRLLQLNATSLSAWHCAQRTRSPRTGGDGHDRRPCSGRGRNRLSRDKLKRTRQSRRVRSEAPRIATDGSGLGISRFSQRERVVSDPQSLVERFGADTVRLFAIFTAPPGQTLEWSDEGVQGAWRFLRRLWTATWQHVSRGVVRARPEQGALDGPQREMRRLAHQTLAKVGDDIGRRRTFNTAIAAVMELLNALGRFQDDTAQGRAVRQETLEIITVALSPIVPHVCHALGQALGHSTALIDERWPEPRPRRSSGRKSRSSCR